MFLPENAEAQSANWSKSLTGTSHQNPLWSSAGFRRFCKLWAVTMRISRHAPRVMRVHSVIWETAHSVGHNVALLAMLRK